MTAAVAAAPEAIAACLRGGGIALLFVPVDGGGVAAARDAVRARCAGTLAALAARHRLAPHASRSATAGLGAVALCRSAAVGVDVERLRPELVDDDLLALALHDDERRRLQAAAGDGSPDARTAGFFAIWTRKEAVMKALGLGLALAPASFAADAPGAGWQPVRTPAGSSRVRDVAVTERAGFAAALAIGGDDRAPVAVRTFWLEGDDGDPCGTSGLRRAERSRGGCPSLSAP